MVRSSHWLLSVMPLAAQEATELPLRPPITTYPYCLLRLCAHTGSTMSRRPYGKRKSLLKKWCPGRLARPRVPVRRVRYRVSTYFPVESSTQATICRLATGLSEISTERQVSAREG